MGNIYTATQNEDIVVDRHILSNFQQNGTRENVVDKTGTGDCLNGVFMNLIANGYSKENALQKAVEIATMSIKDFGILKIKERLRKELDCNELEHYFTLLSIIQYCII